MPVEAPLSESPALDSQEAPEELATPAPTPIAPIFANSRLRESSICDQIEAVPPESLRTREIQDLPRIRINSGSHKGAYVLENWLFQRGNRGRKSWISNHGFTLTSVPEKESRLGVSFWACGLCDKNDNSAYS